MNFPHIVVVCKVPAHVGDPVNHISLQLENGLPGGIPYVCLLTTSCGLEGPQMKPALCVVKVLIDLCAPLRNPGGEIQLPVPFRCPFQKGKMTRFDDLSAY